MLLHYGLRVFYAVVLGDGSLFISRPLPARHGVGQDPESWLQVHVLRRVLRRCHTVINHGKLAWRVIIWIQQHGHTVHDDHGGYVDQNTVSAPFLAQNMRKYYNLLDGLVRMYWIWGCTSVNMQYLDWNADVGEAVPKSHGYGWDVDGLRTSWPVTAHRDSVETIPWQIHAKSAVLEVVVDTGRPCQKWCKIRAKYMMRRCNWLEWKRSILREFCAHIWIQHSWINKTIVQVL